jgi:hypothetical protein
MKKIILIGLCFVTLFGCTKKVDVNPKVDPSLNPKVVSITFGDKTSNFVSIRN